MSNIVQFRPKAAQNVPPREENPNADFIDGLDAHLAACEARYREAANNIAEAERLEPVFTPAQRAELDVARETLRQHRRSIDEAYRRRQARPKRSLGEYVLFYGLIALLLLAASGLMAVEVCCVHF